MAVSFKNTRFFTDANLQALYECEDANDSTANARNLTNTGSVAFTSGAGKYLNGATFDGSTKKLSTGTATWADKADGAAFSVGGWFKPAGTTSIFGHMVCNRLVPANNWFIAQYLDTLQFSLSAAAQATWTVVAGNWIHVVMVVDSNSDFKIYINGSNTNTVTGQSPTSGGSYFGIGGQGSASTWAGDADDVFFFNRVLTDQEVADIYNGVPAITPSAPSWPIMSGKKFWGPRYN